MYSVDTIYKRPLAPSPFLEKRAFSISSHLPARESSKWMCRTILGTLKQAPTRVTSRQSTAGTTGICKKANFDSAPALHRRRATLTTILGAVAIQKNREKWLKFHQRASMHMFGGIRREGWAKWKQQEHSVSRMRSLTYATK